MVRPWRPPPAVRHPDFRDQERQGAPLPRPSLPTWPRRLFHSGLGSKKGIKVPNDPETLIGVTLLLSPIQFIGYEGRKIFRELLLCTINSRIPCYIRVEFRYSLRLIHILLFWGAPVKGGGGLIFSEPSVPLLRYLLLVYLQFIHLRNSSQSTRHAALTLWRAVAVQGAAVKIRVHAVLPTVDSEEVKVSLTSATRTCALPGCQVDFSQEVHRKHTLA